MQTESLHDKFEHLFAHCSKPQGLLKSLGGEIPFFITTYAPAQEAAYMEGLQGLEQRLYAAGISTLRIDLYDFCLQLAQQQLAPDSLLEIAGQLPPPELLQALHALLDMNAVLLPAVAARLRQHPQVQLVFFTGIGQVYPFLRAHSLLNNLQGVLPNTIPYIFCYPGQFTGNSLSLFGQLHDGNYYRAFRLDALSV